MAGIKVTQGIEVYRDEEDEGDEQTGMKRMKGMDTDKSERFVVSPASLSSLFETLEVLSDQELTVKLRESVKKDGFPGSDCCR